VGSKRAASAYWAPMLKTDAHGEIAFAFTAPDSLTDGGGGRRRRSVRRGRGPADRGPLMAT
jgi:hypothetical protein